MKRKNTTEYKNAVEYCSYKTKDAKYTVSLRDVTELGLVGAIRLNIYLVDNRTGEVEFCGSKRIDFYDDFMPRIDFYEADTKAAVKFTQKYFEETVEIPLGD